LKHCTHCGAQLSSDAASFCGKCGASVVPSYVVAVQGGFPPPPGSAAIEYMAASVPAAWGEAAVPEMTAEPMRCAYHGEQGAVAACVSCGRLICGECRTAITDRSFCGPCRRRMLAGRRGAPSWGTASGLAAAGGPAYPGTRSDPKKLLVAYWILLILNQLSVAFFVVSLVVGDGLLIPISSALTSVTGIPGVVCALVWLYRCWQTVPPWCRDISPSAAVGFLFVPTYGQLYWIFRAYAGLSRALRDVIRQYQPQYQGSAGYPMAVATCIITLILYPISWIFCIIWSAQTDRARRHLLSLMQAGAPVRAQL
jgi:hypothetical protein